MSLTPWLRFSFAEDLEIHPKNTLRLETNYNNGCFFGITYIDSKYLEHEVLLHYTHWPKYLNYLLMGSFTSESTIGQNFEFDLVPGMQIQAGQSLSNDD